MRALALAAAALHVVLCAVAAFLMWFAATFPFENQSPERAAADDWLIGVAPVVLILALAIVGAVIARRAALAAVALVAQFAVAAVVAAYALRESDHSDGRLVLYATAVAVTAIAAVTATYVQHR
jgi:quinol-cytochrome oxidoreductase complex cytochrome b subunit